MDHMLGEAVLAGPVIEVFGLGVGYNSLIILSFVASGYFVYRLARLYGISPRGSCVGGFLFAFCPYRFSHLGCLNQIQTQFIPLGLFFMVQWLRTRRARYGVGAALTVAAQSYFGWYSMFHLYAALAVLVGWEVVREPKRWRRPPWRQVVPLVSMAAVLAVPSALPYVLQRMSMPEFHRPWSETIRCSADLLDYVRVSPDNILARLVPSLGKGAGGFSPGFVAIALAALAIPAVFRAEGRSSPKPPNPRTHLLERIRSFTGGWGELGYYPILAATGFILSLGPILHVAGHRLGIPLPYALCYYVIPGFPCMRTPGRFAVLVALATAVLAALGFDALRRRYRGLGVALPVGTLLAAAVLAWCPDLPFVPYPDRASMPTVYGWLAAQPDSKPILEFPVPAHGGAERPVDLRRQMYVLYHGKPRLDGASGFTSNRYKAFRRDMQSFPEARTVRQASDMGARRVIIHYGDYAPAFRQELRDRVEETAALREIAIFGQDVVYELEESE
jgi:hypothetical protein